MEIGLHIAAWHSETTEFVESRRETAKVVTEEAPGEPDPCEPYRHFVNPGLELIAFSLGEFVAFHKSIYLSFDDFEATLGRSFSPRVAERLLKLFDIYPERLRHPFPDVGRNFEVMDARRQVAWERKYPVTGFAN